MKTKRSFWLQAKRSMIFPIDHLFVVFHARLFFENYGKTSPTLGICISTCSLILFCAFFAVPFKHRWGYSQTSLYKDIDEKTYI